MLHINAKLVTVTRKHLTLTEKIDKIRNNKNTDSSKDENNKENEKVNKKKVKTKKGIKNN